MATRGAVSGRILLTARDIHKTWRGKRVLCGADLELEAGTVTWLGGDNGAGKTTLLRVACGLIGCERGTVELDGLHPWRDRREFQRRVGVLPAGNGGLYARLTARDNLLLQAGLDLLSRRERGAAIERAASRCDIGDLMDQRVDRMSMGQRQRVRLAQALLREPDVILLDEPYTSLDEQGIDRLQDTLDELARDGAAVMWLGPSPRLAGLRHDRALWVQDGLVRVADPEKVA